MKPEDLAAFEEWWATANTRLTDIPKAQAVYIYESTLAHRDKQVAQAEPVATQRRKVRDNCEQCGGFGCNFCMELVPTPPAPAVAQPPAEVVRELVGALRDFLEAIQEPPEPNCCCHISPPCADCVEHSHLRCAFKKGKAALKLVKENS